MATFEDITHVRADTARAQDINYILNSDGCLVIEGIMHGPRLEEYQRAAKGLIANAPLGVRDFDGYRTRRIYDPIARTRLLDDVLIDSLLVDIIEATIGPSQFGMTILSEIQPGEVRQQLHRDSAVYPLGSRFGPVQVNSIWAIDEFTPENGATLVALGSHNVLGSSSKISDADLSSVAMAPGSALVYDGRLIHGAGANAPRPVLGLA